MEAVRKSQPILAASGAASGRTPSAQPSTADGATAAKLTIEKFADAAIACLKFSGTIDESFEGKKIARSIQADTLVLDLGGVKKISSFGIREWVDFATTAVKQVKQMIMIECAPKVVDQLNMVANFAGGGRVFSFYAPFRCDYCDSEQRALLEVSKDFEAIKSMKLGDRPCPSCKESMYFDEDGATYFSYVLQQGGFELDADVVSFLAAKLDYRVGSIDQKIRVDKLIDGRVTYLRLTGDLNNTFPREKLAEGLEGTVIMDVTSVARVEPAGAAEWRGFTQMVAPLVEQLYLVGVHPSFLEKLCDKEGLGPKGVVIDMTLPYTCSACGQSGQQSINVAEHHEVLKFATAPELRCAQCKAAMACTASEQAMTILPGLPKPAESKDLERQIGMLKARKFEKKQSTGLAAAAKGAAPRSAAVPILLALLLLVVVAGGIVFYVKTTKEQEPGPYGFGPVVARSQDARPGWIKPNVAPGIAYCGEDGGSLTCVGVSTVSPSQEDAEDEASDAAIESIAFELGKRITDKQWLATIPPIYTAARDAKLAALNRDPQSTQARRDVRDGRRAVAQSLRRLTPALARYWEAFDARDGRRYVAFIQVKLLASDATKLIEAYTKRQTTFGATTVTFFPELAWKFPKLSRGAVVMALEPGVIQELGVAEHSVVLSVDGRDTPDAETFSKIVAEERAQLQERGGSLRLVVQSDSGDPREFSQQIAGRQIETPESTGKRTGRGERGERGSGGVNVWDRFGGNSGSGRDDPRQ
jgi:anti-anti-sigma regulatory factor